MNIRTDAVSDCFHWSTSILPVVWPIPLAALVPVRVVLLSFLFHSYFLCKFDLVFLVAGVPLLNSARPKRLTWFALGSGAVLEAVAKLTAVHALVRFARVVEGAFTASVATCVKHVVTANLRRSFYRLSLVLCLNLLFSILFW